MYQIKIRCDLPFSYYDKVRDFCAKYAVDRYAFCHEEKTKDGKPTKSHYHIYLEVKDSYKHPVRTIKAALVKFMGEYYVPRTGCCSCTLTKEEKDGVDSLPYQYLAYFRKEDKAEYHNFSDEHMDKINAIDITQKSKKKPKGKTVLQQIVDEYFPSATRITSNSSPSSEEGLYLPPGEDTKVAVTKEAVVDAVTDFYLNRDVLVRKFQLISICQTLCLWYVRSYEYTLKNSIIENL